MSDQPQPEKNTESDLANELRDLGQNIVGTLKAAWNSPERQKLQGELETGLNELANTINKELKAFAESPSGQSLKSDVEDIKEKIRTGEAEAKVRQELMDALRTANDELQRVARSFQGENSDEENSSQL